MNWTFFKITITPSIASYSVITLSTLSSKRWHPKTDRLLALQVSYYPRTSSWYPREEKLVQMSLELADAKSLEEKVVRMSLELCEINNQEHQQDKYTEREKLTMKQSETPISMDAAPAINNAAGRGRGRGRRILRTRLSQSWTTPSEPQTNNAEHEQRPASSMLREWNAKQSTPPPPPNSLRRTASVVLGRRSTAIEVNRNRLDESLSSDATPSLTSSSGGGQEGVDDCPALDNSF